MKDDIKTIKAAFYMRDIALLLNSNNYQFIKDSIERLTSLTVFYSDKKKSAPQRFLQHFKINEESKYIEVYFDYNFYQACKEQGLTVNLDRVLHLKSNIAKALYLFITANSGIDTFCEDTMIKRCGIIAAKRNNARKTLVKGLKELVNTHVTKSFSMSKNSNKKVKIKINRYREVPQWEQKSFPSGSNFNPSKSVQTSTSIEFAGNWQNAA